MSHIDNIRAKTLSAPNCTFEIGDPVICRRGPLDPEFKARVVSRSFGRICYDVETADGELLVNITHIRLDEEALRLQRAAEGLG